jgi:hypothetical protein
VCCQGRTASITASEKSLNPKGPLHGCQTGTKCPVLRANWDQVHPNAGGDALPGVSLGRSYLSLDVDGRVVRLDSFAKFMGPGFRLGWATAAPRLIARLEAAQFGATLGPSGIGQARRAVFPLQKGRSERGRPRRFRSRQQHEHSQANLAGLGCEGGPGALGDGQTRHGVGERTEERLGRSGRA